VQHDLEHAVSGRVALYYSRKSTGRSVVISEALLFLKDQLNAYLTPILGEDGTRPDPVGFIDGEKMDPLTFPLGSVSILLINLEEETTLRADNPFRRTLANGTQQTVQPAIRLNLFPIFR
jgi:hypothetical protein